MTAYPGPETLDKLSADERELIHSALVEVARMDALTPLDLHKDKRWILAMKVKREQAVDEEEMELITKTLYQRAARSEHNGMILNALEYRLLAEKVATIKQKREVEMVGNIRTRYMERAALR